jgi:preprotein translocase subunit SecG
MSSYYHGQQSRSIQQQINEMAQMNEQEDDNDDNEIGMIQPASSNILLSRNHSQAFLPKPTKKTLTFFFFINTIIVNSVNGYRNSNSIGNQHPMSMQDMNHYMNHDVVELLNSGIPCKNQEPPRPKSTNYTENMCLFF